MNLVCATWQGSISSPHVMATEALGTPLSRRLVVSREQRAPSKQLYFFRCLDPLLMFYSRLNTFAVIISLIISKVVLFCLVLIIF